MATVESASRKRGSALRLVGLCALGATGVLLAVPWMAEPGESLTAGCVMASQGTAVVSILCGFMVRGRALTLVLVVPPLVYLAIINAVV